MKPITTAHMQRADRLASKRYGIPVLLLMENAGRAVAQAAVRRLRKRRGPVLVLCGGGHNGGDGLAAARTLHNLGYRVDVWLLKNPADWTGVLAQHHFMAKRAGVRLRHFEKIPAKRQLSALKRAALVVDALLGTGTKGGLRGPYAEAIALINRARRPVLAVDVPSGLDADSGKPLGPCVRAAETITMAAPKTGLVKPRARPYVGRLTVAEIGIPRSLLA